jgi:hypothetical protein
VGAAHAGIALDYVYDQADLMAQLEAARGIWPPGISPGPAGWPAWMSPCGAAARR